MAGSGRRSLLRRPALAALLVALTVRVAPAESPADGERRPAPPDLRLQWLIASEEVRQADPVSGHAGERVHLPYLLQNVGDSAAFAIRLEAFTALGRLGEPERLEPGPEAGESDELALDLVLASGMQELCIEASLINADAEDPGDPEHEDNRLCRKLVVRAEPGTG